MAQISIRSAPWLGVLYFAAGGLNVFVFLLTSSPMQALLGLMFVVLGFMNMTTAPVVITDDEVQLKNGFGMVMKRLPFRSLSDLELEGNKLYVETPTGGRQKAASLGFHLNGADKDRLRRALETGTFE